MTHTLQYTYYYDIKSSALLTNLKGHNMTDGTLLYILNMLYPLSISVCRSEKVKKELKERLLKVRGQAALDKVSYLQHMYCTYNDLHSLSLSLSFYVLGE